MQFRKSNKFNNLTKFKHMTDWIVKLDAFLQFNKQAISHNAGNVSHKVAKALAEGEFDKLTKTNR
jgi:hypothetical protein